MCQHIADMLTGVQVVTSDEDALAGLSIARMVFSKIVPNTVDSRLF